MTKRCEPVTDTVRNIRTRPTNEIKDFEWVPRNLVIRYAHNMSPCSLGALRDPPCFFLLDVLTYRPPDGQDLSSVNSRDANECDVIGESIFNTPKKKEETTRLSDFFSCVRSLSRTHILFCNTRFN